MGSTITRQEVGADRQSGSRIGWLDALRGWAVLGVVLVHSAMFFEGPRLLKEVANTGIYGVQLFFIVSALTIGMTYDAHIKRYGRSLRVQAGWFVKRFFRIAPLYYVAALYYPLESALVYFASGHKQGQLPVLANIGCNLLFVHTWVPSANNSVVPGGWSIGVEMFFYLTVPLIWMVPEKWRAWMLLMAASCGIALSYFACHLASGSYYIPLNSYFYFWFPAQMPVLAIGLILYFRMKDAGFGRCVSGVHIFFAIAGFLLFFATGVVLGPGMGIAPVFASTAMGVSFILLIMGMFDGLRRIVAMPWMINVGKISYSIYIVHFFILDIVRFLFQRRILHCSAPLKIPLVFAAVGILSVLLAMITKRLIEDPGNAIGHRISARLAGPTIQVQTSRAVEEVQ